MGEGGDALRPAEQTGVGVRIENSKPPMWAEMVKAFPHVYSAQILVCWGNTIYLPNGGRVTRELQAHEEKHFERQGPFEEGIKAWWKRYLVEPGFRLREELPAHRAEYLAFCKRHSSSMGRVRYLNLVAERLAGPLYGGLIDREKAKHLVLTGECPHNYQPTRPYPDLPEEVIMKCVHCDRSLPT